MARRIRALNKDPDGFPIPDKLINDDIENDKYRGNWSVSNEEMRHQSYTKAQLQNRCRLYKIMRTALENPKQKNCLTNSTFNQIYKDILEPTCHSSFVSGLKEIVKLVLEGAGIPSTFVLGIKNWLECDKIASNLNELIFDIQDNNTNIIQYYPIRPRKQNETGFEEFYISFFSDLGERFIKRIKNSKEFDSLETTSSWLKELGGVSLRPLRHSGSVALNSMLKGVIKGKKEIYEKLMRFRTQIENESEGSKSFKSMEEEISRYSKLSDNLDDYICNILNNFWKLRVQDVSEDIRLNCLKAMSNGIIQIHISEVLSKIGIFEFLSDILTEDIYINKILILNCLLNCFEIDKLREDFEHVFTNRNFLKNLKNMVIIASKLFEDDNIVKCGELSLLMLLNILKKELLDEEFVDEIVDLLWLSPCSINISVLLAEFIDFALFDGGITHNNIEARELIELVEQQTENKKLRSLMNLDSLRSLEATRIRSDLQTLLDFIHEFGKDFVTLTHRCVNAFWTKAPCVRDTRFLVEMLVLTECSINSEIEPLDEDVRKTLLLVLHSNISHIEETVTNRFDDSINSNSRIEGLFGRYRAFIAISTVLEYMEPLILVHEKHIDHLTILLSTFSTCMGLYCRIAESKENSNIIPSGMKHFPLNKFISLFKTHSDPRIIDGICMIFSPLFNLDCKQLIFHESSLIEIQSEILSLKKELFEEFLSVGRGYLAATDNILYSNITDDSKKSKKNNLKNPKVKNSTINTICKFRRVYGIIKYLTIDNIYLNCEYGIMKSSSNISEMSPEQSSGVPFSFEVLIEVLERSERIIQGNNDDTLIHQTAQLFCVTLDILTTGYTHLVQDLLQRIDTDNINDEELEENIHGHNIFYGQAKESTIEIFKSLRHKFSCILIETIRYNLRHQFNDHQCFNYLSILSMSSILVIFGLQGIIESTLRDFKMEIEIKWTISDSDLSLIIKEYIYWTSYKRGYSKYINNLKESDKICNSISSSLIDGFNSLITFCDQDKPYYLLYPNCRIFEPLDNLKDETYVTTNDTLNIYKKKLDDFMEHPFLPGCMLSLLAISCQNKSTIQIFTPIIFNYLIDVEEFMVNNYYLDIIQTYKGENNRDKLIFSNKFLESLFSMDDSQILGAFSCILISMIIYYKNNNFEKAKLLSKKLIPVYTGKIGWKKMEEIIKLNISDLITSIIECLRFSLFGELTIPIYRDIISRDEIIVESIKTKGLIKFYLDFLTTQNAPGGNKNVLNVLSNEEIHMIFDQVKILCDFDDERSAFKPSYSINKELFESDIKDFLDHIANLTTKKNTKKNRNSRRTSQISEIDSINISKSKSNFDINSPRNKTRKKRTRKSKTSDYNSEDECSIVSLSDYEYETDGNQT